jgi:hypothetical protein
VGDGVGAQQNRAHRFVIRQIVERIAEVDIGHAAKRQEV